MKKKNWPLAIQINILFIHFVGQGLHDILVLRTMLRRTYTDPPMYCCQYYYINNLK